MNFMEKLPPNENFYMPVITVDNKKRQKVSEKNAYPYVNPYAISANLKDKFRRKLQKFSTHMRAEQVAKDYCRYMGTYQMEKDR